MVKIKPFKGIRPRRELAKEVAARPYDVLNSEEAKAEANEKSLLHITRPEIDFTPMVDETGSAGALLCVCADYGWAYAVWAGGVLQF